VDARQDEPSLPDRATHVPVRQDSELAESVRFPECGEEALSELPEVLGSLPEKLPARFKRFGGVKRCERMLKGAP